MPPFWYIAAWFSTMFLVLIWPITTPFWFMMVATLAFGVFAGYLWHIKWRVY